MKKVKVPKPTEQTVFMEISYVLYSRYIWNRLAQCAVAVNEQKLLLR
jgi:hypothetical protein